MRENGNGKRVIILDIEKNTACILKKMCTVPLVKSGLASTAASISLLFGEWKYFEVILKKI